MFTVADADGVEMVTPSFGVVLSRVTVKEWGPSRASSSRIVISTHTVSPVEALPTANVASKVVPAKSSPSTEEKTEGDYWGFPLGVRHAATVKWLHAGSHCELQNAHSRSQHLIVIYVMGAYIIFTVVNLIDF